MPSNDIRPLLPQRGVTLIELVVTMAVVAILAALAAPSFAEYFEKQRLRAAADDMITMIADSRVESIKRDRDVRIKSTGSSSVWCAGANGAADPTLGEPVPTANSCNCTVSTACLVGTTRFVVDGAQYPGVTIDAADEDFTIDRKLGTIANFSAPSMTLTSSSGNFALNVNVTALGQATACVPAGKNKISGYPSC